MSPGTGSATRLDGGIGSAGSFPLGPEFGEPEPVGNADTVATAFEVVIAAGALLLLRTTIWRRPLARFSAATAVATLAAIGSPAVSLFSLAGL